MSPAGDGLRTGVHTVVMSGGGTPREREAGWSEGPLPWWSCFPFDRGASPAIRCTTAGAETRNAPGPTRRATAWRRAGPGSTAARAACRARRGRSRVPPVCVQPLPRRRLRRLRRRYVRGVRGGSKGRPATRARAPRAPRAPRTATRTAAARRPARAARRPAGRSCRDRACPRLRHAARPRSRGARGGPRAGAAGRGSRGASSGAAGAPPARLDRSSPTHSGTAGSGSFRRPGRLGPACPADSPAGPARAADWRLGAGGAAGLPGGGACTVMAGARPGSGPCCCSPCSERDDSDDSDLLVCLRLETG